MIGGGAAGCSEQAQRDEVGEGDSQNVAEHDYPGLRAPEQRHAGQVGEERGSNEVAFRGQQIPAAGEGVVESEQGVLAVDRQRGEVVGAVEDQRDGNQGID